MPVNSVVLTSAAVVGPSAPILLNYKGGNPVYWAITVSSSVATGSFQLQTTTADLSNAGSFVNSSQYGATGTIGTPASSIAVWTSVSSTPYGTLPTTGAIGFAFLSSQLWPDGVSGTFVAPACAARLWGTAMSSHTINLAIVQPDGG